ncbi:hypothetical protein BDN72DRAFT_849368 [Pluteus cervinus]|uniref:Uncharacterized protein n=1 Tax=Pluteus cervinus TaxID=181527 RepID=A0ACD3A8D8_9AGAR|nr:hypothetical protein BDN72DRAFT_849368 [Pluteus cervinus]
MADQDTRTDDVESRRLGHASATRTENVQSQMQHKSSQIRSLFNILVALGTGIHTAIWILSRSVGWGKYI